MKAIRHRRLLIALIVIVVGLLVGLAWLVWPESPPKDPTLRLKFVKSEVVDGKTKLLFRVEGAEKYAILIRGFRYLHDNDQPEPLTLTVPVFTSLNREREFYADPPQYSPLNVEGWKLQANVSVMRSDHNLYALYGVIRYTWHIQKQSGSSVFSAAKLLWDYPTHSVSEQTITSEVLTNVPLIQF